MLGLINISIEEFIKDVFGVSKWREIVDKAGADVGWISTCPYSDKITYELLIYHNSLVNAAAAVLGITVEKALEAYGEYFVKYAKANGFEKLLLCLGSNFAEFVSNINNLHLHLSVCFPSMNAPAFRCAKVSDDFIELHYFSRRLGLWPLVAGILRSVARNYFRMEITVELLRPRDETQEYDALLIRVESQLGPGTEGLQSGPADMPPVAVVQNTSSLEAAPLSVVRDAWSDSGKGAMEIEPEKDVFDLFPFHIAVDSEMRVVRVGAVLRRLLPEMWPGDPVTEFFTLRQPNIHCTYTAITENMGNAFLLRCKRTGLELKGQMIKATVRRHYRSTTDKCFAAATVHPVVAACHSTTAAAAAAPLASQHGNGSSAVSQARADARDGKCHSSASSRSMSENESSRSMSVDTSSYSAGPIDASAARLRDEVHVAAARAGASCPFAAAVRRAPEPGKPSDCRALSDSSRNPVATEGEDGRCSVRENTDGALEGDRAVEDNHVAEEAAGEKEVTAGLICLCAPRMRTLDDLQRFHINWSDIPLHDSSRDYALLVEQLSAEAELKERLERLTVELKAERERSDRLLYQMLPEFIADRLRCNDSVEAKNYSSVSVLFSDVVGFTQIAAVCTPMEVCQVLNRLYTAFDAVIEDFPDIYKVETAGDAYMLVCGATSECDAHVDKLLDAGLGMLRAAGTVSILGQPICIRIGIHSGPVVGGVVGSTMPRFCFFGDAVNTASRMQSTGRPGAIHLSAAAHARLRQPAQYAAADRGEVLVKGKGPMRTFLLVAAGDIAANAAAAAEEVAASARHEWESEPLSESPRILPTDCDRNACGAVQVSNIRRSSALGGGGGRRGSATLLMAAACGAAGASADDRRRGGQ